MLPVTIEQYDDLVSSLIAGKHGIQSATDGTRTIEIFDGKYLHFQQSKCGGLGVVSYLEDICFNEPEENELSEPTQLWSTTGKGQALVEAVCNFLRYQKDALIFHSLLGQTIGGGHSIQTFSNPIKGAECVYAVGLLQEGQLLEAAQRYLENKLINWEECRVTVYQYWYTSTSGNDTTKAPASYCYCTLAAPGAVNCAAITTFPATILRHKHHNYPEMEYECSRFKDWFAGLDVEVNPTQLTYFETPGIAVLGEPPGLPSERMLGFPTADFEEALTVAERWKMLGATNITLCTDGLSMEYKLFDEQFISQARAFVAKYDFDPGMFSYLDTWLNRKQNQLNS